MRANLNYLLLLRPAGKVNWKVNTGEPLTRKALGCASLGDSGGKGGEGWVLSHVALLLQTAQQLLTAGM